MRSPPVFGLGAVALPRMWSIQLEMRRVLLPPSKIIIQHVSSFATVFLKIFQRPKIDRSPSNELG